MNTDPLSRFVRENREDFDSAQPPTHLWEAIQTRVQPELRERRIPVLRHWHYAVAASVLILIGAGLGWWVAPKFKPQPDPAMTEFLEAERFYQQRIAQTVHQLESHGALSVVEPDMEEIARSIEELKTELEDVPPPFRQEVIRSLIKNYQVKLELLDHVLHQIETTKSKHHDQI